MRPSTSRITPKRNTFSLKRMAYQQLEEDDELADEGDFIGTWFKIHLPLKFCFVFLGFSNIMSVRESDVHDIRHLFIEWEFLKGILRLEFWHQLQEMTIFRV